MCPSKLTESNFVTPNDKAGVIDKVKLYTDPCNMSKASHTFVSNFKTETNFIAQTKVFVLTFLTHFSC